MNREKDKKKETKYSAKEVAISMTENMAKNMNDPNFFSDQERMRSEVTNKVIKKRELRKRKLEK